jgi:hypothetical protein
MTDPTEEEYRALFTKQNKEIMDVIGGGGYRITNNDGRTIIMESLNQFLTQGYVISGFPRGKGVKCGWIDDKTYRLHAPEKEWDLFHILAKVKKVRDYDLENPPVTLPRVTCTADLTPLVVPVLA